MVLLKDFVEYWNNWLIGIIDCVFLSDDGIVRKVVVWIIWVGKLIFYIWLIYDFVLLIESE